MTYPHFLCFCKCLSLGNELMHGGYVIVAKGIMYVLVYHTHFEFLDDKSISCIFDIHKSRSELFDVTSQRFTRTLHHRPEICQGLGLPFLARKCPTKSLLSCLKLVTE